VRVAEVDAGGTLVYDALAAHLPDVAGWAQSTDGYAYVLTYGSCLTLPVQPGSLYRATLAPSP
jgi:hypothetical protein